MKSIHTLKKDIYELVSKKDGWFTHDLSKGLGDEISSVLMSHFNESKTPRLRLSQMGPKCHKALWHSIHTPELAEPLPPQAMIKFSFGHILEAEMIAFSKAAGHEVTGEQDELDVLGVKGHRDCVIDGCVVDVKSCSSRHFQKFAQKTIAQDDPFGYLDQLDGYLVGSLEDDLVRVKDKAYILAIDKTLGKVELYEHQLRRSHILGRVADYKAIVARHEPPACTCETVADGESGNIALGVKASYSAFKHVCFPNLRTFLYSTGPRYLTRVVKRPSYRGEPIVEVDKNGKFIYN